MKSLKDLRRKIAKSEPLIHTLDTMRGIERHEVFRRPASKHSPERIARTHARYDARKGGYRIFERFPSKESQERIAHIRTLDTMRGRPASKHSQERIAPYTRSIRCAESGDMESLGRKAMSLAWFSSRGELALSTLAMTPRYAAIAN